MKFCKIVAKCTIPGCVRFVLNGGIPDFVYGSHTKMNIFNSIN